MPTLTNATAAAMCNAAVDRIDTNPPGSLKGYTSGGVEVFTCVASNPAFGAATTASPAVATAAAISDDTSATGGNLTGGYHAWEDGNGLEIWRGTIGTSGTELIISSLTIGAGDTVSVSAYTASMPTT